MLLRDCCWVFFLGFATDSSYTRSDAILIRSNYTIIGVVVENTTGTRHGRTKKVSGNELKHHCSRLDLFACANLLSIGLDNPW